jgi:hypothetical protein
MKAEHKKELKRIYGELEQLKADAERIYGEMEEVYEGKSDKWKEGDAGEAMQEEMTNVQELIDGIENAYDHVSEYTN